MPININPSQTPALASFAGNPVPNLNLKTYGIESGGLFQGQALGLFKAAELAQQQKTLENAMTISQLNQSGQNQRSLLEQQVKMLEGSANRQNATDIANQRTTLGYDKLGVDSQYKQQILKQGDNKLTLDSWYKQNQVSQKDQELHQKQVMDDFTQKMKMKDQDLDQISKIMGGYTYAQQTIQDPEKLSQAQQMVIGMAKENGLMTNEMANKVSKLSTEQFGIYAASQGTMAGKVLMAKGMGLNITTNPDGTVSMSQGLTQPVQTAQQTDIANNMVQLGQLESIGDDYSKKYLTYTGSAKALAGNVLSKMGADSGQDLQQFAQDRSGFVQQLDRYTFEFVKAMSGVQYSDKQLQAMRSAVINSSDSPAEFNGKFKSMLNFMKASLSAKQDLLQNKIPLNNKSEFESRQAAILNKLEQPENQTYSYSDNSGNTYNATQEDVEHTAKQHNISVDEVKQKLGIK